MGIDDVFDVFMMHKGFVGPELSGIFFTPHAVWSVKLFSHQSAGKDRWVVERMEETSSVMLLARP